MAHDPPASCHHPHWIGLLAMGLALGAGGCVQYYTDPMAGDAPSARHAVSSRPRSAALGRARDDSGAPRVDRGDAPARPHGPSVAWGGQASGEPADARPRRQSNVAWDGSGAWATAAGGAADWTHGQANVRQVTFATEGGDFDVTADAAGKTLVFASTRHRTTADIYLKKVGGTAVTQLTDEPADDVMPAISPDGQSIAFASNRSGNWDIYLMPLDGGPAQRVTDSPAADLHPSFSPDGRRVVYCSYTASSGRWELALADLARPGVRTILGHGMFPQWSPKGDKILFQRSRQRGTRWFSIWTVDLVDGQAMRPTQLATSRHAAAITPGWSPDGSHIVFCTVIDPGADNGSTAPHPTHADVWVMRADGSERSRLTGGQFANLQPVWAGDGSIFFVSNRADDGIDNVWMVRVQDDPPRKNTATALAPTP